MSDSEETQEWPGVHADKEMEGTEGLLSNGEQFQQVTSNGAAIAEPEQLKKRKPFDEKDLEITCLEQEIDGLKKHEAELRLVNTSQKETLDVLRTENAGLRQQVGNLQKKLRTATKKSEDQANGASAATGLTDERFGLVRSEGMQALFKAVPESN